MNTRRVRVLAILFIAVLLYAGISLTLYWSKPALQPALPSDLQVLDLQLQLHLSKLIAEVKRFPREPQVHAALALAYSANSLWKPAREEFQSVARLAPKEPLAGLYVAVATLELGDAEQALILFRDLAREFPSSPQAQQRLGELALRRGNYEEAEGAFARLTQLAPKAWHGFAGLAQVKMQQRKSEEARKLLEEAISLEPTAKKPRYLLGTILQASGETNQAALELCLGGDSQDSPMTDPWGEQASAHMKNLADQIEMAREMREHGEGERAANVLLGALKYHPTNAALINSLAITYNQIGRPDLSLPLLQKALSESPRDLTLRVSLSHTQQLLGQNSEALQTAASVSADSPALAQGYLAQANALLALEKDADAASVLQKASDVDPANELILIELGDVLWKNLQQPDAALEKYRQAIQLKPCSARAYFALAELHKHLGNQTEAQKCADTGVRLGKALGWDFSKPSQKTNER